MVGRSWFMVLGCAVAVGMVTGCKEVPKDEEAQQQAVMTAPVASEGLAVRGGNVVTVNGEALTRADLEQELDMITASPQFAALPPEQAVMIRQQMEARVIDRFVSQKVLAGAAEKENVEASAEEIDEFLEGIQETLPEGVTLAEILEERSLPIEKLRSDIGSDIKIRKLLEARTQNIAVASDEQISAYYEANREEFTLPESVHALHILVRAEGDEAAKTEARAKIEGLREQLVAGTLTFEEAAKAHSDCPSGQRGGDLGVFMRGQMVPEFEAAAFSQEMDTIGPVVETPFGFHVLMVVEKTEAGERSLDDVKADISEQLSMQDKQIAVQDYLDALRDDADIKYGDQ